MEFPKYWKAMREPQGESFAAGLEALMTNPSLLPGKLTRDHVRQLQMLAFQKDGGVEGAEDEFELVLEKAFASSARRR